MMSGSERAIVNNHLKSAKTKTVTLDFITIENVIHYMQLLISQNSDYLAMFDFFFFITNVHSMYKACNFGLQCGKCCKDTRYFLTMITTITMWWLCYHDLESTSSSLLCHCYIIFLTSVFLLLSVVQCPYFSFAPLHYETKHYLLAFDSLPQSLLVPL